RRRRWCGGRGCATGWCEGTSRGRAGRSTDPQPVPALPGSARPAPVRPAPGNALNLATPVRPGRRGRSMATQRGAREHGRRTTGARRRPSGGGSPAEGAMIGAFASRANRTIRLLWLLELAVLLLAVTLAVWLRFIDDPASRGLFVETAPVRTLLVALFVTGAMAACGLYQPHVRHNRVDLMLRIGLGFAFGGVGLLVLYYLVPATYIGRGVLAIALAVGFALICTLRLGVYGLFGVEAFK